MGLSHTALNQQVARKFAVADAVHPDDHIYNFVLGHPGFNTDGDRVNYYFNDGSRSATQFLGLVKKYVDVGGKPKVFEFASGYGCVTRHLVKAGDIDLESCDIHPQAVAFLRNEIGATAVQSASIPEMLAPNGLYDVVFALSFFSHMPITTWARWLVRLCEITKPGGIVVFTTQGRHSMKFVGCEALPESGFWFKPASEQSDIPVEEYGLTVISPELVKKHIHTIAGVEILAADEAAWWGHQDLFVVHKSS